MQLEMKLDLSVDIVRNYAFELLCIFLQDLPLLPSTLADVPAVSNLLAITELLSMMETMSETLFIPKYIFLSRFITHATLALG